jgi:sulfite exporter TauE/SafE
MLALYIAGTREGWWEGLKATLVFSLARVLAYVILGMLAGFVGGQLLAFFEEKSAILWIQLAAGAFVIMLGLLIILGRNPHLQLCRYLSRYTLGNSTLSMALLGFLIGIVPYCVPFLGILTYIAFSVENPLFGALCGLAFGLGAALITPLIVAGPLAGLLPKLAFKSPVLLEAFRRISGVILLLFGVRLALNIAGNI